SRDGELRPAGAAPLLDRLAGGYAYRDAAFLVPFADDAHDPTVTVEVVDVEAAELTHPDASGVQQLEDGAVTEADRGAVVGVRDGFEDRRDVVLGEHAGQRSVRFR